MGIEVSNAWIGQFQVTCISSAIDVQQFLFTTIFSPGCEATFVLGQLPLVLALPPIQGSIHCAALCTACHIGQMSHQALLAIFMLSMPPLNLLQAVAHQEFVVAGGKYGRRDVDKDRNPGVAIIVAEDLATKEDRRNDPRSQISGKIGGYRVGGKSPNHGCIPGRTTLALTDISYSEVLTPCRSQTELKMG
jgi:hypothetical protein